MDTVSMSDDEFLKMTEDELTRLSDEEPNAETSQQDPVPVEGESTEVIPDVKDISEEEPEKDSKQGKEEVLELNENEVETSEDNTADKPSEINYKEEYDKIMAPFRANNKDVQVDNTDDVRRLMQMGSGFNKRMEDLKPNLKLIKMLSNNDLLDEEKLSYLIDLDKKNPNAVAKLLKDSEIDPLDIDVENNQYTPNTYTVDDQQVALEQALEGIETSPSYQTTLDVLNNKLDDTSKEMLLQEPAVIGVLNDHIASGIYDKIDAEMSKERMLGRLNNMSTLEAYKTVGDRLNAAGAFNNITAPNAVQSITPTITPASSNNETSNVARKLAARTTKGTSVKAKDTDAGLMNLSDSDFEKAMAAKLI